MSPNLGLNKKGQVDNLVLLTYQKAGLVCKNAPVWFLEEFASFWCK